MFGGISFKKQISQDIAIHGLINIGRILTKRLISSSLTILLTIALLTIAYTLQLSASKLIEVKLLCIFEKNSEAEYFNSFVPLDFEERLYCIQSIALKPAKIWLLI